MSLAVRDNPLLRVGALSFALIMPHSAHAQSLPDVIVGDVASYAKFFKGVIPNSGSRDVVVSYAFGTATCNIGVLPLGYAALPNTQHPVTTANIYRVHDGSFEQLGLGFGFHHFCALQQSLCATCQPVGGGCPAQLGVGCSDVNAASSEGAAASTRPRSIINPSTGSFNAGASDPPTDDPVAARERVRVRHDDLTPALNVGASYFVECQIIHPDDAPWEQGDNNASYRRVAIGADSTTGYALSFVDATVRTQPALEAWRALHPDVRITAIDVPLDGRLLVADRAWEHEAGVWRYEYCVFNLDSDRAGAALSVEVPNGANISAIDFHRPLYHSGEPWGNEAWSVAREGSSLSWTCPETYAQDPNAAALRWSSMYTFRFDSPSPPAARDRRATLKLFKPGATSEVFVHVRAPEGCIESNGDLNRDGSVNAADLSQLLAGWGGARGEGDLDCDGAVGASDLAQLLAAWSK